jgi:hypothetical protein
MLSRLRDQSQLEEDRRIFYYHIFESMLTRIGAPSIGELFRLGGVRAWERLRDRFRNSHPFASQMFDSMVKLQKLNEEDGKGWLTAPLVGHSASPEIFSISMAEGLILEQAGLTHVGQLFGVDELTGRMLSGVNRSFDGIPPNMANKCRLLRSRLCALGNRLGDMPAGCFGQVTDKLKLSQLHRRMHRKHVDGMLPGPPAYFTRRKDGIPVPPLVDFMKGYDTLFKLNIPSKTLETSFLLLNRQIWTKQASLWMGCCLTC